jgi:hypothetical protein
MFTTGDGGGTGVPGAVGVVMVPGWLDPQPSGRRKSNRGSRRRMEPGMVLRRLAIRLPWTSCVALLNCNDELIWRRTIKSE